MAVANVSASSNSFTSFSLPSVVGAPPTIRVRDLPGIVSKVNSNITLGRYLGRGGFGIAFSASIGGEKRVVKFTLSKRLKPGQPWNAAEIATLQHKGAKHKLEKMREECKFMWDIKHSKEGMIAVKDDPDGARVLNDCVLNCHPKSSKCRTGDAQPPFIVLTFAGTNAYTWLQPEPKQAKPSPVDIVNVLNQVRQGIRFIAEKSIPPRVHHDLKWGNVCVYEDLSTGKFNASIIDWGASLKFVNYYNRSYAKPPESTPGYAGPEFSLGLAYADPPWAFDVYALGAMGINALCDIRASKKKKLGQGQRIGIPKRDQPREKSSTYPSNLRDHASEMKKLLVCNFAELCVARDQCIVGGNDCCPAKLDAVDIPNVIKDKPTTKKPRTTTCDVSAFTKTHAENNVDFSKPRGSFDRFDKHDSYYMFHREFCRVGTAGNLLKMDICESMLLLLHPNPLWRPKPTSFLFVESGVEAKRA